MRNPIVSSLNNEVGEPWVHKHLFDVWSFGRVFEQEQLDEFSALWCNFVPDGLIEFGLFSLENCSHVVESDVCMLEEGVVPTDKAIHHDPEAPHVAAEVIRLAREDFWGDVGQGTECSLAGASLLHLAGEAEVNDLRRRAFFSILT